MPGAKADAVLVAHIEPAQFPASASLDVLDEAIPRACLGMGFDGISAILLPQPDCLQMPLATIGRLDIPALDQPLGRFHRAKAKGRAIGGVVRDLLLGLHWAHFGYGTEGKEILRESRLSVLLFRGSSEGAPCARLVNCAFDVNIREIREKRKPEEVAKSISP